MNTDEVRTFFDRLAPTWDAGTVRRDDVIDAILDNAAVTAGKTVLDVACGTGVLIPDYLARGVRAVTGVDLSPEMIKIAKTKFADERVRLICDDVETAALEGNYDCIVVYNAFPHFPEPARLIARLTALLAPGGVLTVAHDSSREAIDRHHEGRARYVSRGLLPSDELAALFARGLAVTVNVSNDRMYQVAGMKND